MSVIFLVLYFAVMLGIGFVYQSRQTTVKEFVTAGQGLGYWVATFSARTTGESGWLLLGLTGAGYAIGFSAFWVVIGEVVGVAISWLFIIPRFKKEVTQYKSLTMLDYFEDKLEDRRHILRWIFTIVLMVMVTAYISAQLTATGKAFNSFYDMNYLTAQFIGLAIILAYVTMGGFRAVAISDFIQGILMLVGLLIVPVYAIIQAGGWDSIMGHLSANNPELLNFLPEGDNWFVVLLVILGLAGPGLGFLGSPQVYQRIIALDEGAAINRAKFVAIFYTLLTDAGAVMCGIAGRYFLTDLADVESVYPDMIAHLFPVLLVGLFMAIVLSAIMSTADSLLILASTTLVRDFYQKIFKPDMGEKQAVLLLRVATVGMSLVALAVSSMEIRLIFWFALFGWAGIACSFCPPLILTLFWKKTNRQGVIAGSVGGFLTCFIWKMTSEPLIGFSLYEMIPGFLVSFLLTGLFSLIYHRKKPAV